MCSVCDVLDERSNVVASLENVVGESRALDRVLDAEMVGAFVSNHSFEHVLAEICQLIDICFPLK